MSDTDGAPSKTELDPSATDEVFKRFLEGFTDALAVFGERLASGLAHMTGRYPDNEYADIMLREHRTALKRQRITPKGRPHV